MEAPSIPENIKKRKKNNLRAIIKSENLKALQQRTNLATNLKLFEELMFNNIRSMTYDSKYLHNFNKGRHATNENFTVEKVRSSNRAGFKIFKADHMYLKDG